MHAFAIGLSVFLIVAVVFVFAVMIFRFGKALLPLFGAIWLGISALGRAIGRFFAMIGRGMAWIAKKTASGFCAVWRALFSRKRKVRAETNDSESDDKKAVVSDDLKSDEGQNGGWEAGL